MEKMILLAADLEAKLNLMSVGQFVNSMLKSGKRNELEEALPFFSPSNRIDIKNVLDKKIPSEIYS